jgi:transposase
MNAVRLLRDIQEQGYTGGITVLREFMHPLRPVVSAKATVRFETDPGEQAQVDLGAFPYIGPDGKRHTIWCLAMVLSYSRMLYVEFIKASDQLHILQAMRNAFEFFGGVPKTVLSDNCSPLVISNDGQGNVHWQPPYLDFAKYYGFVPKACKPYRSRTKGKIERPIGYMRQSFWPVEFTDQTDLNQQLFQWRDTVANVRVHGTTREIPLYRFAQERLGILPTNRYPLGHSALRKVSNDCRVSWNSNLYSVPWKHVGQTVWVREYETGLLQIEAEGQIVAEHRVLPGRHLVSANPEHTRGITPTASVAYGKIPGTQIGPEVEQRDLAIYEEIALGGRSH